VLDADRVSAELAAIREDLALLAQLPPGIPRPNLDRRILEQHAPRLLRLAEAVLELHRTHLPAPGGRWECPTLAAIERELTRKDGSDGNRG
jgi:hypothetical protein